MWPDSMASLSACSSIRPPRAQLTTMAPLFISDSRSALRMCLVSLLSGTCRVTTSALIRAASGVSASSILSCCARTFVRNGSKAMIFMLNASARFANSEPILPMPRMASFFSLSSMPLKFFLAAGKSPEMTPLWP